MIIRANRSRTSRLETVEATKNLWCGVNHNRGFHDPFCLPIVSRECNSTGGAETCQRESPKIFSFSDSYVAARTTARIDENDRRVTNTSRVLLIQSKAIGNVELKQVRREWFVPSELLENERTHPPCRRSGQKKPCRRKHLEASPMQQSNAFAMPPKIHPLKTRKSEKKEPGFTFARARHMMSRNHMDRTARVWWSGWES